MAQLKKWHSESAVPSYTSVDYVCIWNSFSIFFFCIFVFLHNHHMSAIYPAKCSKIMFCWVCQVTNISMSALTRIHVHMLYVFIRFRIRIQKYVLLVKWIMVIFSAAIFIIFDVFVLFLFFFSFLLLYSACVCVYRGECSPNSRAHISNIHHKCEINIYKNVRHLTTIQQRTTHTVHNQNELNLKLREKENKKIKMKNKRNRLLRSSSQFIVQK